MWLHPSFFSMGKVHLGHRLVFAATQRALASSFPLFSWPSASPADSIASWIFDNQSIHFSHEHGEWATPPHEIQKAWPFPHIADCSNTTFSILELEPGVEIGRDEAVPGVDGAFPLAPTKTFQ